MEEYNVCQHACIVFLSTGYKFANICLETFSLGKDKQYDDHSLSVMASLGRQGYRRCSPYSHPKQPSKVGHYAARSHIEFSISSGMCMNIQVDTSSTTYSDNHN